MFRQTGDLWGISRALHGLGAEYMTNKEPEKARSLYKQSIKVAREAKDRQLLVNNYNRLSEVCMHEKRYGKATEYPREAPQIAFDIKSIFMVPGLIRRLGETARLRVS